jgi:hypothetical protein
MTTRRHGLTQLPHALCLPCLAGIGLSLLLCITGCGAGQSLRPTDSTDVMRFVATLLPVGDTPARGPVNLAFVTTSLGFAATTGGMRFVPRDGWGLPSAPGEIEFTNDGGATRRTLWRGPLSLDALAVRRRVVVAAGLRLQQTGRITHRGPLTSGRHFLIVSATEVARGSGAARFPSGATSRCRLWGRACGWRSAAADSTALRDPSCCARPTVGAIGGEWGCPGGRRRCASPRR